MDNIAASCRWCNDSKGLKTEQEYLVYMEQKKQPDEHALIHIICEKIGIDPDVYGSRARALRFALNFTVQEFRGHPDPGDRQDFGEFSRAVAGD